VDYIEPSVAQLCEEFATSVATNVSRILVDCAPQSGMLRHGDDQAAAGTERLVHCRERAFVVVDVFEHIERTDDLELGSERQISSVQFK
jgi:hypothetical protein